jgi:hypothetical protein
MVFIMQKDQINVNKHGHKPSLKLLDQISDRLLRVKGQLAKATCAYALLETVAICQDKSA